MKKVICFVGVSLVIGVIATATLHLLNDKKKKKCEVCCDCDVPGVDKRKSDDDTLTDVTAATNEPTYEEVKSSAVRNMHSRHEGAAAIMRDSIETISENVRISKDANDEIDAVSDELGKMQSED